LSGDAQRPEHQQEQQHQHQQGTTRGGALHPAETKGSAPVLTSDGSGEGGTRGLPPPRQTSVHQLPCLSQPQCMLLSTLAQPLRTSVQMPLGHQNCSAH
jgi:hypothetical protein